MNYPRPEDNINVAALNRAEAKRREAAARFNIKDFFMLLLMNWFWFVLCAIVAFGIGFLYVRTIQPRYERVTDLQIKFSTSDELDMRTYLGIHDLGVTNMSNELYILNSLKLAGEVAERLHLDVTYYKKGAFRKQFLYSNRPFTVNFVDPYQSDLTLSIVPVSPRQFRFKQLIADGKKVNVDPDEVFDFNEEFPLPELSQRVFISVTDKNYPDLVQNLDNVIQVVRRSPLAASHACRDAVQATSRASAMVRLTCVAPSVEECDDILRCFFDVYNEQTLEEKNAITISSAKFVEERIRETAQELGEAEGILFNMGMDPNQVLDDKSSFAGHRDDQTRAEEELADLHAQLDAAYDLRQSVRSSVAEKEYISSLKGIDEAGISGKIDSYNSLVVQRNRLIANSSANNPALIKIDANLSALALSLTTGMDSYVEALSSKVQLANKRVSRYSAAARKGVKVKYDSTSIEAKSLSITRDYKQSYFSFLLKKREELRLQIAVSEADTRLIENPMGSSEPVYPIASKILLKFVIAGVSIPGIVFLLMAFFNSGVRGRKDIEDTLTMPYIGEIPEFGKVNDKLSWLDRLRHEDNRIKSNRIVVTNESKNALAEGMHIVQSNLSFITVAVRRSYSSPPFHQVPARVLCRPTWLPVWPIRRNVLSG